jgi:hypothetical protein
VSYTTLKKQYDAIRRISLTSIPKQITTSNRFDSLAEKEDHIETLNIVETNSSIKHIKNFKNHQNIKLILNYNIK